MATAAEQALLQRGLSQGQGLDIFALAAQQSQADRDERPTEPVAGTGVGLIDVFTKGARTDAAERIKAAQAKQRAAVETEAGANLLDRKSVV